ncbi:MAG TPA: PIN domain-containing protein [candidate division Zixibacteria bacterium]|nr:PIN domain-containing protein [candidate division Zixibacteria bacterium]
MSGKFLLDTNILIALFSGDTSVQVHLKNANEVFISSTVLGELYFGDRKSHHGKKNLAYIPTLSKFYSRISNNQYA